MLLRETTTKTMKLLVAIHAHAAVSDVLRRHWPYYWKSGGDLLIVGRTDKRLDYPMTQACGHRAMYTEIGTECGPGGSIDNHLERFLETIQRFLFLAEYEVLAITEYDTLWFHPLAEEIAKVDAMWFLRRFHAYLASTETPSEKGWHHEQFWHQPWIMGREMARQIYSVGKTLLRLRLLEGGFTDRWLGMLLHLYGIPVEHTNARTFSVNAIDTPVFMAAARRAIKERDVYFIHGVKTEAQLKELLAPWPT